MKKLIALVCLLILSIPMSVSAYDYEDDYIRKIYITYDDERVDGKFELMENTSASLGIKTTPSDAPRGVKWRSSNTKIATVDQNGRVTAIKQGTCTVYATSTVNKSVYDKFELTVTKYVRYPDRITVAPQAGAVFETGETVAFSVQLYPQDTTEKEIHWKVSGGAEIDRDGNLKILDKGEIKVFAYSKDYKTVGEYTFNSKYSGNHFTLCGGKYNVPQDRAVIIKFDANVSYISAHAEIFASADETGNGEKINIKLDIAGDTVTVSPATQWQKGDVYIFIKSGLGDIHGNLLGRSLKYKLNVREV